MNHLAQSIIETIRDPLLVLDEGLRVRIANRSFYRMFRTASADVEGRHLYELGNGEWNVPQLQELLAEISTNDTHFEDFEIEHNFPSIGHKTMLLNARRVRRGAGEEPLILLAFEDITELRRTEGLLKVHIQKLEWSNRELQDFANIASHDLQEPLRAIQAFGERLSSASGEALNEEARDYLDRMLRAATRMRGLIRDLLNFSRITTKARPFAPVDLNVTVQQVLADLTRRLEETGGHVDVGTLPTVQADSSQMRQLLQNLIDNALKYYRHDEPPRVTLRCETVEGDSDALGKAHPSYRIEVRDNGIGFDQKHVDRIFTPFQRLHSRDRYEGTGIGLAICRKIVEHHGGTLTAHSVPDEGSVFVIEMPIAHPE